MDITTVDDRPLYQVRILVQDPQTPPRQIEMPRRIIGAGPAPWL